MLKEVRENAGKTIMELSRESGVSRWLINMIEKKGYDKAKPETKKKLANVLKVDVEQIR